MIEHFCNAFEGALVNARPEKYGLTFRPDLSSSWVYEPAGKEPEVVTFCPHCGNRLEKP